MYYCLLLYFPTVRLTGILSGCLARTLSPSALLTSSGTLCWCWLDIWGPNTWTITSILRYNKQKHLWLTPPHLLSSFKHGQKQTLPGCQICIWSLVRHIYSLNQSIMYFRANKLFFIKLSRSSAIPRWALLSFALSPDVVDIYFCHMLKIFLEACHTAKISQFYNNYKIFVINSSL